MKLSQLIPYSALLAGVVLAIPGTLKNSITLSNGRSTVPIDFDADQAADTPAISVRADVDCKGSSLCRNNQDFKDQCARARGKIENTEYRSGGAKSGVCDGHCGIFVQGNGCSASGGDLRNGYDRVRAGGCQACGSYHRGGGCLITVNYVSRC